MRKLLMILFAVTVLCSIAAAVTYNFITPSKPKTPIVSENINIPMFIDTSMKSERNRNFRSLDTTSQEYKLGKLGFTAKSSTINTTDALIIETLHQVYDSFYPNHQFINHKVVNELIKKYGLAFGNTQEFICDVPTKELNQIDSFKINNLMDREEWWGAHDIDYTLEELATPNNGYGISPLPDKIFEWAKVDKNDFKSNKKLMNFIMEYKETYVPRTQFFMIAPPSCFRGNENAKGNFGEIKDPIVLAPVFGGYIIVTAW